MKITLDPGGCRTSGGKRTFVAIATKANLTRHRWLCSTWRPDTERMTRWPVCLREADRCSEKHRFVLRKSCEMFCVCPETPGRRPWVNTTWGNTPSRPAESSECFIKPSTRKMMIGQTDQRTSSVLCSYSGGSEELSDDITQQQLLPGVKYVRIKRAARSSMNVNARVCRLQRSKPVDGQM